LGFRFDKGGGKQWHETIEVPGALCELIWGVLEKYIAKFPQFKQ